MYKTVESCDFFKVSQNEFYNVSINVHRNRDVIIK